MWTILEKYKSLLAITDIIINLVYVTFLVIQPALIIVFWPLGGSRASCKHSFIIFVNDIMNFLAKSCRFTHPTNGATFGLLFLFTWQILMQYSLYYSNIHSLLANREISGSIVDECSAMFISWLCLHFGARQVDAVDLLEILSCRRKQW